MDNAQLLNIEPKPNVFEFSLFEGLAVVGVGLLCERFTIGDMCKMSVDEAQIEVAHILQIVVEDKYGSG